MLSDDGFAEFDDLRAALYEGLTRPDPTLRPVAIAGPAQVNFVYLHATGMQQTWFFAPFQSHNMVTKADPVKTTRGPRSKAWALLLFPPVKRNGTTPPPPPA